MKWKHSFYQNDNEQHSSDFYHSQRKAAAIHEMEAEKGLYSCKVVEIRSNNEYKRL